MSNIMRHAAGLVPPIVDRIVARLCEADLLHVDGTGIDTKHPGGPGKHRGQIAVCCTVSPPGAAGAVGATSGDPGGDDPLRIRR